MKQITGYVALIDVLGFSNMMSVPDAATSLNRYTDCVTEAASSFDGTAPIDHLLFSDSILLNTSEDSVAALLALLRACGILVSSLLAMDILTRDATLLAAELIRSGGVPEKAKIDALHIAVASVHGMDYLVSWNCTHIANATMRGRIEAVCRGAGFDPPVICTPLELVKEQAP